MSEELTTTDNISNKNKQAFLRQLLLDVMNVEDYFETPFRKMLLAKIDKVENQGEKWEVLDVIRHAIPMMCIVNQETIENAKKQGNAKYIKPLVDKNKMEEIHYLCFVPKFRHHWDVFFAFFEMMCPEVFNGNAADCFLKGFIKRKLHPDLIENFDNELLGYITLYAQGAKQNSFYVNPVDCLFNITGVSCLLGNEYDLESDPNLIMKNTKLCEILAKEFDRAEAFVTGTIKNNKDIPINTLLQKLHINAS